MHSALQRHIINLLMFYSLICNLFIYLMIYYLFVGFVAAGQSAFNSSQEVPTGYLEQDAEQGASNQFAERDGSWLQAVLLATAPPARSPQVIQAEFKGPSTPPHPALALQPPSPPLRHPRPSALPQALLPSKLRPQRSLNPGCPTGAAPRRAWTPPPRNALRPHLHDGKLQQQEGSVHESACLVQNALVQASIP